LSGNPEGNNHDVFKSIHVHHQMALEDQKIPKLANSTKGTRVSIVMILNVSYVDASMNNENLSS